MQNLLSLISAKNVYKLNYVQCSADHQALTLLVIGIKIVPCFIFFFVLRAMNRTVLNLIICYDN